MKNLLVITLLFLVGCSQNFRYVLDCEMSERRGTEIVERSNKVKISFNDIKVGNSLFYNLVEFKIVDVPNENSIWYPRFYAEKIYPKSGPKRDYLEINRQNLYLSHQVALKIDNEWKPNRTYFSFCKLR